MGMILKDFHLCLTCQPEQICLSFRFKVCPCMHVLCVFAEADSDQMMHSNAAL